LKRKRKRGTLRKKERGLTSTQPDQRGTQTKRASCKAAGKLSHIPAEERHDASVNEVQLAPRDVVDGVKYRGIISSKNKGQGERWGKKKPQGKKKRAIKGEINCRVNEEHPHFVVRFHVSPLTRRQKAEREFSAST